MYKFKIFLLFSFISVRNSMTEIFYSNELETFLRCVYSDPISKHFIPLFICSYTAALPKKILDIRKLILRRLSTFYKQKQTFTFILFFLSRTVLLIENQQRILFIRNNKDFFVG